MLITINYHKMHKVQLLDLFDNYNSGFFLFLSFYVIMIIIIIYIKKTFSANVIHFVLYIQRRYKTHGLLNIYGVF